MASSMASSTEADLTQVIPMLVDGIAQEIGVERRDMRVTFVADHRQHDLSSWSYLKRELMTETHFVWQRPNDLNHPRAYFEISLDNESLLMNPINTTSGCVPKDIKGSGAYTEPGQPAALWQADSYGSALSTLRTKLLAAMEGPFTTKAAPRLHSVVQFQMGTHVNRMTPHGWTGSPLALEAFLHLHAWHAKYPKDSGNKYCLELNTHSAGVYGIAFELHTVLQHQWKYGENWLTKLQDFDLLTHYGKRKLCESALQSLGYDPKRIHCKSDPEYGHVQLDTSGEADADDYDAQISALMEGRTPLAETDHYRDFLIWDDQHRSWRLPFAFLPATDVSPPVFFSCTWRKSEQGWKTSATPPYSNLIRDVRSRRPDNEVLHIQLHASDLAMLPFHTRLMWLIPFPAEWYWLPAWCPGTHPTTYVNSEIWKKHQNVNTQSSSSTVPVVSSMPSSSTSAQSISSARPTPSCAPTLAPVAEDETEPEVTQRTAAIPQSDEVPTPQAFPLCHAHC